MAKTNTIVLCIKGTTKQREFSIEHALNVLRLPNSQWEVADEGFIFENNDIRRVPSKTDNTSAEE